ncbi:MAG TPA: VWA domain-containing protein, partial [Cytophagaceae bacterium]
MSPFWGIGQQKNEVKTTRILFILDASGSMTDKWESKTRMAVAKEVLSQFVDSLKNVPNLELGLRVYGHEWDKRYNNCKDTKLEVKFARGNHENIKNRIKSIEPKGVTLISYSLLQAANDFPEDKNTRNVIILLTDGIEACGGDPCALSLSLQKKRIFLKPFIIGMGADPDFEKAFGCMGQYFDAPDVSTFKSVMGKILKQTLSETSVIVNLLDDKNKPTETDVNMTFFNSVTGEAEYDFVHFLDGNGKPDKLKIDAILSYNLVVHTIPKTVKTNIFLEGGKENIINVKTPQGTLLIKDNYKEYNYQLKAIIREDGKQETLHIQNAGTKEKYLTGKYDIEILTLPRIYLNDVKIEQGKTTTVSIAPPGVLSISESVAGFGSIY